MTSLAITVPMFVYWPTIATPVFVHVMLAPMARVAAGQPIAPILLSLTATFDSATFPVFVTVYAQVMAEPVATVGPGAVSLSVPFVVLTRAMAGLAPKYASALEAVTA